MIKVTPKKHPRFSTDHFTEREQLMNINKHLRNSISAMKHNLKVAKKNRQFGLVRKLTEEIKKIESVYKNRNKVAQ